MNRDYEALSAFLDGETNELETRRVLRDLPSRVKPTEPR